jgi:signal transduction histidine kinase
MKRLKSLKLPNLRLYQQIILFFGVLLLVPLLGVSVIIYNINQYALKKELSRFTEHTASALYRDLQTEMSWQQDQVGMIGHFLMDTYQAKQPFQQAAQRMFQVASTYEGVAIYDNTGHLLEAAYRRPEHQPFLPAMVPVSLQKPSFKVLHAQSPYLLQITLRMNRAPARFMVLHKRFNYLEKLVTSRAKTLHDGVYIVDREGNIIAGPTAGKRMNPEDFGFFEALKPGVAQEFETPGKVVHTGPEEEEDPRVLQKVFVKMPTIEWGIVLESPYHVRQKYLKRARTQSLILIGAYLGLVVLLGFFYILGISRNFRQLIKGTKALTQGNYGRRIRLITNASTPYEIIYLAAEFNHMSRKVADSWRNIHALNAELSTANEKLAKLDEMKSNLIDTVSHELRTPLTSIKGYTSRLLRYDATLTPETRTKSLKVIKQQADRLSRLVDDLLVIPELEAYTLRVFPDRVEVLALLERCVQFIQEKEHRPIELSSLVASPLYVLADPDRLEQVLLNLLDNAVKYATPEGRIRVWVAKEQDGQIPITVANPCDPLPPEAVSSLCQKFKRLDETLTRTTRGTGLGLYITKGLMEAMGGRIALRSPLPTVFEAEITIPVATTTPHHQTVQATEV